MAEQDTIRPLAAESLVGQVVEGKYAVESILGEGGMGRVYVARDGDLGRRVALKALSPELSGNPTFIERFKREARAAAAIGHPNIVQVIEIVQTDSGIPCMVMELLDGRELREELRSGRRMPVHRAVDIAGQVLFALSAAHRVGIVHRDLKPENIFLAKKALTSWHDLDEAGAPDTTAEVIKILDFGISRFLAQSTKDVKLTATGMVMGTAHYMAPEQVEALPDIDGRADLFAVGVILYQCLTGYRPFEGDNVHTILHHVITQPTPDPREHRSNLPDGLAEVVMRAMEKDRSLRFQSADEFIIALRPFVDSGAHNAWSGHPIGPAVPVVVRPVVSAPPPPETSAPSSDREAGPRAQEIPPTTLKPGSTRPTPAALERSASAGPAAQPVESAGSDEGEKSSTLSTWSVSPPARQRRLLATSGLVLAALIALTLVYLVTAGPWSSQSDQGATEPVTVSAPQTPTGDSTEATPAAQPEPLPQPPPEPPVEQPVVEEPSQTGANETASQTGANEAVTRPATATQTKVDAAPRPEPSPSELERARGCLRRGDRACCLAALANAPEDPEVLRLARQCRRLGERTPTKAPPESSEPAATQTSPPPIARSLPDEPPATTTPAPAKTPPRLESPF